MRFSRPMSGCLYASLVAILLALPLSAQAQQEEEYVLRTYEVGDLTMNIADRPYGEAAPQVRRGFQGGGGGGFGGGGGGQFSMPEVATRQPLYLAQMGGGANAGIQQSPRNSMDDLIDVIVTTTAPESWDNIGSMRPFGTALVVWQTEPVHQRIEQLLTALRAGTGNRPTLKVDARWLLLNSDDLAQLAPTDDSGTTRIDRQVLAQFTRRPSSIRGLTSCFSGQLVYVVSGTQRNVVSGYIPVVGSVENPQANEQLVAKRRDSAFRFASDTRGSSAHGSSVGYQPIVQKVNFGALLEIRPTLVPSSETAVVDLTATITVPGAKPDGLGEPLSPQSPPFVDRIAIETQQLATTLRLPLAEPVIVGGLTYKPASIEMGQQEQAVEESPQLYLILQIAK